MVYRILGALNELPDERLDRIIQDYINNNGSACR